MDDCLPRLRPRSTPSSSASRCDGPGGAGPLRWFEDAAAGHARMDLLHTVIDDLLSA